METDPELDVTASKTEAEPAPQYRAFVALESEDRLEIVEGPPWRPSRLLPAPSGPHNVAADPAGGLRRGTEPARRAV